MPGTDTITVYRGEDASLAFTMSPVEDVTGWTLALHVKLGDVTSFSLTGAVDDGPNGQFSFALADTDTENLTPGTYTYDAWRTDAGSERVLAVGSFVIKDTSRDVTT